MSGRAFIEVLGIGKTSGVMLKCLLVDPPACCALCGHLVKTGMLAQAVAQPGSGTRSLLVECRAGFRRSAHLSSRHAAELAPMPEPLPPWHAASAASSGSGSQYAASCSSACLN